MCNRSYVCSFACILEMWGSSTCRLAAAALCRDTFANVALAPAGGRTPEASPGVAAAAAAALRGGLAGSWPAGKASGAEAATDAATAARGAVPLPGTGMAAAEAFLMEAERACSACTSMLRRAARRSAIRAWIDAGPVRHKISTRVTSLDIEAGLCFQATSTGQAGQVAGQDLRCETLKSHIVWEYHAVSMLCNNYTYTAREDLASGYYVSPQTLTLALQGSFCVPL